MSPATGHYEAALARDLGELRAQLRQMADLVLGALRDAGRALRERDRRLAYTVILADNRIDALEGRIDRLCQEFLVRHMPAGAHLRFIVAAIKVNSELERMGDYADAIAHRVVTLHAERDIPTAQALDEMFTRSIAVLDDAVTAFVEGDIPRAESAIARENEVDAMNHAIFSQLARPEAGAEQDLTKRFAVLAVLNRLERVADRAVNIAEDAIWAVRGEVWRHSPTREHRVLFVSPADATLGPMAEAIARARAPLRVSFASVGIEPTTLNPRMVAFMAKRGFDVSRPRPRALADAGPLEDYEVVVTLSQEAEDRCPDLPYRTIGIFWDIADPSRAEGDDAEIERAFDTIFHELEMKIGDLIAAIAGATAHDGD